MRELKNSSQKFLVQYEMIFYDVKCKKRSPIKMCDIVVITTKPMLNFYHVFVPHVAHICQRLTDLLGGKKKRTPLVLEEQHRKAFVDAKNALANASLLVHPVIGALLALTVDALCGRRHARTAHQRHLATIRILQL